METTELLNRYQGGVRSFPWADLSGADLSHVCLRGANFNRANLRETRFIEADLSQVNFTRANLTGADFRGANLVGAQFRKANLSGARIDLAGILPTALIGAILPDGTQHALVVESPPVADPPEAILTELPPLAEPANIPATLAQFHQLAPPPPPPPPPPLPSNWVEIRQVLPWTPLVAWMAGLGLMGLLWVLAWGAWVSLGGIVAIALLMGAKTPSPNRFQAGSWTQFVPVVFGLLLLLGSPMTNLLGLFVGGLLMFLSFFGLWVAGWTARKALQDCCWLGGLSMVLLLLYSWIPGMLPPDLPVRIPGLLLIPLFVMMFGALVVGVNSLEAMAIAGLSRQQIFRVNTCTVLLSLLFPVVLRYGLMAGL